MNRSTALKKTAFTALKMLCVIILLLLAMFAADAIIGRGAAWLVTGAIFGWVLWNEYRDNRNKAETEREE